MCSVENHRVWPLILTICVLGVILLVILGNFDINNRNKNEKENERKINKINIKIG
jgi:hypothetical protein